jgi:hypothetical protein
MFDRKEPGTLSFLNKALSLLGETFLKNPVWVWAFDNRIYMYINMAKGLGRKVSACIKY